MTVQPNKAIVGANAFAHESGIHQDGVLKNRLTYEIIDAKTVGLSDNKISLGKLSGRSAVRARLEEMGYDLSREDLNDAFARFKDLADRKREITDRDLEAIVSEQVQLPEAKFQLSLVQVSCGNASKPTATISLLNTEDNSEDTAVSIGTGPVDAVCEALNKLAKVPNELIEFSVKSVTEGIDALGEVTIRIRRDNKIYSGHSADTDVVVAAANAYVNALNRLVFSEKKNSISNEDVRECKQRMNTFAYIGSIRDKPIVKCVYQTDVNENKFIIKGDGQAEDGGVGINKEAIQF